MLAGICGGLEDFTGIDVTIWRLLFVLLTIAGAVPGPLIYIIMWIIVPRHPA